MVEDEALAGKDARGARWLPVEEMGEELGKAVAAMQALMRVEEKRPQGWRVAPGAGWSALRNALAHLYPERAAVLRVAEEAGVNVRRIDASGAPLAAWEAVLREARHAGRLDAVLEVASREYESYGPLNDARAAWERDRGVKEGEAVG